MCPSRKSERKRQARTNDPAGFRACEGGHSDAHTKSKNSPKSGKAVHMADEGRLSGSFLGADEGQAPERYPGPEQLHLELHALRTRLESTVSPGGLVGVSLQ